MRVLLLSSYDTLSHRYWRESLVSHLPDFSWTVLALPPRFFNFRVRSNPLTWLGSDYKTLSGKYDLVIATSLVDASALRGLIPSLASTPLWVYCHENQFAYPESSTQKARAALKQGLDVKMVFLYNLLCADCVSFNSEWNCKTALQGIKELFAAFPEKFDQTVYQSIHEKCGVLPVPLVADDRTPRRLLRRRDNEPLTLIWNHRWEYDKGPDFLLAFARVLEKNRVSVLLHVVGQQFRQQPQALCELGKYLDTTSSVKRGQWGFVESKERYSDLLHESDFVLSTALHDFQGLSVLEAVEAGCMPLVPDALVYPEQYPAECRYRWVHRPDACAQSMFETMLRLLDRAPDIVLDLEPYHWKCLQLRYEEQIKRLANNK